MLIKLEKKNSKGKFYCKNRGECNYIEAREQFARKVLETDKYYNGHIRVRVHKQVLPKD